jgi:hypothetical protein
VIAAATPLKMVAQILRCRYRALVTGLWGTKSNRTSLVLAQGRFASASALFPRVFACGRILRLAVEWSVRSSTPGSAHSVLRMERQSFLGASRRHHHLRYGNDPHRLWRQFNTCQFGNTAGHFEHYDFGQCGRWHFDTNSEHTTHRSVDSAKRPRRKAVEAAISPWECKPLRAVSRGRRPSHNGRSSGVSFLDAGFVYYTIPLNHPATRNTSALNR